MLAYFIKVNVAIVLFYAFYRLFFYKDTFFDWRRIALLCFFALSAAYPLLNIQTWIIEQEPMVAMTDLYASVMVPELTITTEASTDWKSIILNGVNILYLGVTGLLFIRFLVQLTGIIRLSIHCRIIEINGSTVHVLANPNGPFSFFNWIFIHPSSHTKEEIDEILTHEQTHARQWHSLDVLISELTCIICWFNPFIWLMKREIRTNLEYMADACVLKKGYDSKTYQYHLLGLSHHKAAATIYNSFNVLPLKKRIKMMNNKRTKEIGRTKYLIFLPLAALLMIISNIEAVARTTEKVATDVIESINLKMEESTLVKDTATTGVIFEVVEQMPIYPGGINALIKYLSNTIEYPTEAKNKKLQGVVTVSFVVNKDGSISDVKKLKGVDPLLDTEAIRVISAMPKWKPGMQKGQKVRVRYTAPINFKLPKKEEATTAPKEVGSNQNTVFEVVENMPAYPGGMNALLKYLSTNIRYPAEAVKQKKQGKVIVNMIIDENGNVTNPKIKAGIDPLLDAEAIRLINSMPKWKAGTQRGKAVKVRYTIPITFKL